MKSQSMIDFLDSMSRDMFGRTRSESLRQNICVDCGGNATTFRDELSKKEYGLSGLCQNCQNKIFDVDNE